MHRKYRTHIAAIFALVSTIFVLTGCSGISFRESKDAVFSADYELLTLVADYLVGLEHENVYITSTSPEGEISVSGKIHFIDNDDITNAIALLKESGCSVIDKNGGIVTFVYRSTMDVGKGFAFSSDGSKPQLQFQTYLEELSAENWFYYEEDFNLWRLENQANEEYSQWKQDNQLQ